jgi:hypothetical protein
MSKKYYFVQLSTGLSQWEIPTLIAPIVGTPTPTHATKRLSSTGTSKRESPKLSEYNYHSDLPSLQTSKYRIPRSSTHDKATLADQDYKKNSYNSLIASGGISQTSKLESQLRAQLPTGSSEQIQKLVKERMKLIEEREKLFEEENELFEKSMKLLMEKK